jgi:hypothetical protein
MLAANLLPSKTIHSPLLGLCQITKKSRAIRRRKPCRNGGNGIQGTTQNRPRWSRMSSLHVKRTWMIHTKNRYRAKRSDGAKFDMIWLRNFRSKEPDGLSQLFFEITSQANFTGRKLRRPLIL